jgi:adenosylhomocysteinase
LANAGHFDVEISKPDLTGLAVSHRLARPNVEEFVFADGRRVYLLGEGRLINLATGQGHPVEIMDLSFSLQALSVEYLARHGRELAAKVHPVPPELDLAVARAALAPLNVAIDEVTEVQRNYRANWMEGT